MFCGEVFDDTEAFFRRSGVGPFTSDRSRPGVGEHGLDGDPHGRHQRGDLLQVAQALRRYGPVAAARAESDGEGERSTEADRCGTRTGQADPEGEPGLFKAQGLTIADLRQAVVRVRQKLDTSERRTCKTIGLARSPLRYQATPKDDDELRLALIRLAKQYGRYGYRKIAQLLRVEGWVVNHKKVERL